MQRPYRPMFNPGHGGRDSGAVGNGLKEKDLTLKVSLYAHGFCKADPNYDPLITRTDDLYISPDQAVFMAHSAGADVLVADHFNSAQGRVGDGLEVYPKTNAEVHHKESIRLAQHLIDEMKDLQPLRGINGIRYAYLMSGGISFAESNHPNINRYRSYYGVVRNSRMPAVLVESAFINNPNDIKDFNEEWELKRLGARRYHGICAYFGTTPIFDKNGNRIGTTPTKPPATTGFTVQVTGLPLNIRSGPGVGFPVRSQILQKSSYTITEENGAWGKLKSGAGWITLDPRWVQRK